ncbi:MAG: FtsX-like permease family protein, partial [Acetatifactor sp.]|nr:FtsX-like permease family protein [Acetatifactor sp.]
VIGIISWLVSYTINFMLGRRSREFGLYVLIGLESGQVARLFFLENMVVGGCALALGIPLGNLLYQILRAIVLSLFGQTYIFGFSFSLQAVGLTLLCFVLIYLFAQLKNRKRICSMKIHDLIHLDRQNEGMVIGSSKKRRKVFILSLVLGLVGTILLMLTSLLTGIIGSVCIIIFLYSFFLSFASGVPAYFDKRPGKKYQGQTLLVFRTLTAKLATMGVVMATIALLFTATLISEGCGLIFQGLFYGRARENSCFDIMIGISDLQLDHGDYLEYFNDNIPIKSQYQYEVYQGENTQVMDYLMENTTYYAYHDCDLVMAYSDYAFLRRMLGYPEVTLEAGQYLFHCRTYLDKLLEKYTQPVVLAGQTLMPEGVYCEPLGQYGWEVNGSDYILVVPDALAEHRPVNHHLYVALTEEPLSEVQYNDLRDIRRSRSQKYHDYDNIIVRSQEERDAASFTAMMVFPLYYLALVLTMTSATILTIQLLSEAGRYQHQFRLLQKLGMDRREMAWALRKQFAVYYAMPAIPPLLIGIPFIRNLSLTPEPGILTGATGPAAISGIAVVLYLLIYFIYILLAYNSLKRSVLPE